MKHGHPGPDTITPAQLRAARGLVDISQAELCQLTGLGISTITSFERGRRVPKPDIRALIRGTLERAGVEFIEEDGRGDGVKLADAGREPALPPPSDRD